MELTISRVRPTLTVRTFAALALVCLPVSRIVGDELQQSNAGIAQSDSEQKAVRQIFRTYCFECHTGESPEGDVRLDRLDHSFGNSHHHKTWQTVLEVVRIGRMPPEDAKKPTAKERGVLAGWLTRGLTEVALDQRQTTGLSRNRRLTVEEYNFTMQSLFGVDAEFGANLPPDPVSAEGFQNTGELLGLSPLQLETYLDNARRAVRRYVQFGASSEQPLRYFIEFEDLYYTTANRYRTRDRAPRPFSLTDFDARRSANRNATPKYVGPLAAIPPGGFPTVEELRLSLPKLHQQFLALPEWLSSGELIVRVRAAATPDRKGRYPRMRVEAGIALGDGDALDTRVLGESDVTAPLDRPQLYEFRKRIEDIPTKGRLRDKDAYDKLSMYDLGQVFVSNVLRDDRAIYALGPGTYADPAAPPREVKQHLQQMAKSGVAFLYLDSIEVEMLPTVDRERAGAWSVDVALAQQSKPGETKAATQFLERFMRRAFRRPVSADEVTAKIQLFEKLRAEGCTFEESLQETLAAVLISPSFLFLDSVTPNRADPPVGPTPYELASRLSYLLWLTAPDDRLMQRADDGSLLKREVLRHEAARMLDDARSRRFVDSFCRQWLRLDKFPLVAVNPEYYPRYDDDLAQATVQETLAYFADVFASRASALELLDSDYAFLNNRLADHYGLDMKLGGDLQKVRLPAESIRGGLLTQASLLTMNSDGADSHPIKRGVWLLDRLLNDPPPPPPANVPDIDEEDPDFRGLSLQERIELHRKPTGCRNCHAQIDPWGLALENFDATGRWREQVQVRNQGDSASRPVDAAVQLPDAKAIEGIGELKRHLREARREQFTRAIVHHMLTYALGRRLDLADRQDVDRIHERFAQSGYRLKDLVLTIVESDAFCQ